jgi:hypothetical protein
MLLSDKQNHSPSGLLILDVFRHGKLIDHIEEKELIENWGGPNLIVDNYKQIHARLLGGDVTNRSVTRIGFGTSGTAPAGGNTSLTGAYTKNVDAVTYPLTNQVQFAFSLGTGEANPLAIMEFGLFTAGGVLYARKVRSAALNKETDLSFSGTWLITF